MRHLMWHDLPAPVLVEAFDLVQLANYTVVERHGWKDDSLLHVTIWFDDTAKNRFFRLIKSGNQEEWATARTDFSV